MPPKMAAYSASAAEATTTGIRVLNLCSGALGVYVAGGSVSEAEGMGPRKKHPPATLPEFTRDKYEASTAACNSIVEGRMMAVWDG